MKASKTEQEPQWQKTPIANLVRNAASNNYYGRLRVSDKLIWKSLKTGRMRVVKIGIESANKRFRSELPYYLANGT